MNTIKIHLFARSSPLYSIWVQCLVSSVFHLLSIPLRRMHNLSDKSTPIRRRFTFCLFPHIFSSIWNGMLLTRRRILKYRHIRKLNFVHQSILNQIEYWNRKHWIDWFSNHYRNQVRFTRFSIWKQMNR